MRSSKIETRFIQRFVYERQEWFWNGFFGFFFQPVGPKRSREKFVHDGDPLYAELYAAAGQP